MPQKKKSEDTTTLTGISAEGREIVQKANELTSLFRSNLSLIEFKLLDAYLARIDSRNPEQRTVVFEKGELERLFGVKRLRNEVLDARVLNLMQPLLIPDDPSAFERLVLYEKAYFKQDEDGLWKMSLTATPSASEYFFNVEQIGYIRSKKRRKAAFIRELSRKKLL